MQGASARSPRLSLARALFLLGRLGATGLRRRLVGTVALSLPSALAQAGVLVLVTAVAAGAARGARDIRVHGLPMTRWDAFLAGWGLLAVFVLGGLASAQFRGGPDPQPQHRLRLLHVHPRPLLRIPTRAAQSPEIVSGPSATSRARSHERYSSRPPRAQER